MIFYKGVNLNDLTDNYIPGSVTTDIKEAWMWKERIESKKKRCGKTRHVRNGKSIVIRIDVDVETLYNADEFQRNGVSEHTRRNCWMNCAKTKAQINTIHEYVKLSDAQAYSLVFK